MLKIKSVENGIFEEYSFENFKKILNRLKVKKIRTNYLEYLEIFGKNGSW